MRRLLFASLAFVCLPAIASAGFIATITDVQFSADQDTATVTLSQSVDHVFLRYDVRIGDETRQIGGAGINTSGKVLTITGLANHFQDGPLGTTYSLHFQVCSKDSTYLEISANCGPEYIKTLVYNPGVFSDVPPGSDNADAIAYVRSRGVVQGYSDGTFRPHATINRAEFTKIVTLYKFGQEMIDMCGTRLSFGDVSLSDWFGHFVCRAKDAGIIEGYPDGTFRPQQNISFVEAAKIIARTDTFNAGDPVLPPDTGGPWYEVYVQYLAEHNAIPTSIDRLDHLLTRGEMAEIIFRLQTKNNDKPSKTYEELSGSASVEL